MPKLPPSPAKTVKKLVKHYLRLVPRKVSKPFKAGVSIVVRLRVRRWAPWKDIHPYKDGTKAYDAFCLGVAFAEKV